MNWTKSEHLGQCCGSHCYAQALWVREKPYAEFCAWHAKEHGLPPRPMRLEREHRQPSAAQIWAQEGVGIRKGGKLRELPKAEPKP